MKTFLVYVSPAATFTRTCPLKPLPNWWSQVAELLVSSMQVQRVLLHEAMSKTPPLAPSTSGSPVVLIVEDIAEHREVLRFAIEDMGFEVRTASNGHEGLAAVESGDIDLVLSDQWMPLMTGSAMVKAMHANPVASGIPVVMMSSDPIKTFTEGVKLAGTLHKPFTMAALEVVLRKSL